MENVSEVEALRYQVEELRHAMGLRAEFPRELRLTPYEARMLGLLTRRDIASKEYLFTALYADDWSECREPKVIEVFLSKLRKKLSPFGVTIRNDYGHGWYLSKEDKAKLKAMGGAL